VKPAIEKAKTIVAESDHVHYIQKVTELNVQLTIERIRKESPIIAALEQENKVQIVGGLYNIETGVVQFYPTV
jgi:carbonic anhydrase